MANYTDTLGSMKGQVLGYHPLLPPLMAINFINQRIRQVIDGRPFWSDLLRRDVIGVPDAYSSGTVSVTSGSSIVTGSGTGWPYNDVVDTIIPSGVKEIGYVRVVPASMSNITDNTMLYVDAGGTPETVAVVETGPDWFTAKFRYFHNSGCSITSSSLCGRQFRVGENTPIFTVRSVHSDSELEIDYPWSAASLSDMQYTILLMYINFGSDFKDIIAGVDQQTGNAIRLHVSVKEMNARDPQRRVTGYGGVTELVDLGPSESGVMQFELWPAPSSARQLQFIVSHQWPELKADSDRPPFFIDPTVFINGAIASALRWRAGKNDPYHNIALSRDFEMLFNAGMQNAINADEAKCLRALDQLYSAIDQPQGAYYEYSHDYDVNAANW